MSAIDPTTSLGALVAENPICGALESDPAIAFDEPLVERHEREHAETGDGLAALRELTDDYNPAHARCGTHRRLLEAFRDFELDLHPHVHEENNVLLPRVRALAALQSTIEGRLP